MGTGKTMLAERLPSILPPLDTAAALEVTRAEVAGELAVAEDKIRVVRTKAAKKFGKLVGERLADLAESLAFAREHLSHVPAH